MLNKKLHILLAGDAPIIQHSVAIVLGQLAKQFINLGHKISFLGYGYSGKEVNHKDGYIIYPDTVPLTTKQSFINLLNKIEKVDIIILHGSKDVFKGAIEAGKEKGIPVVCHTFYSTPVKNDKVNTFEAKNGFILYDCAVVDDMFVCNNFSVGVGFALGKRTWYIPNGVDMGIFKPMGDNYRKALDIPENAFVFLFSGSNIAGKDPGRALDAFARFFIKNNRPKDTWLAMHTIPNNSHLNLPKIAEDLGVRENVKFFTDYFPEWLIPSEYDKNYQKGSFSPPYTNTPYSQMPYVYRTGNVALVPTLMEGQSTTILEMLASSLPVIISDDEVVSETVVNFQTGLKCRRLLTNECNTEDMVEHMEYFYNNRDEVERMGNNASEYIRIKHDWNVIAQQFLYHFKNLIDDYYK